MCPLLKIIQIKLVGFLNRHIACHDHFDDFVLLVFWHGAAVIHIAFLDAINVFHALYDLAPGGVLAIEVRRGVKHN